MKKLIFYLLFTCVGLVTHAQHPYYYTIHDDDGLPSNEVYQLHQDSFGYVWIGCNAGLYRYDGFIFTPYKNINQNSVAISGLCMAQNQKLYCQNFSGQIFYANGDSLILLTDVKERIRSHPAYTIDNMGNAWMGLPEGILKRSAHGAEEVLFKGELYIIEFEPCADGSLYAIDISKGLIKIVSDNNSYRYKQITGDTGAFKNSRTAIERAGDKIFTLSSSNRERNYSIAEIRQGTAIQIAKFSASQLAEFIYSLSVIDGKIWLGTSSGAYCLDMHGAIEKHCFETENISDIIRDREGNYWFSSLQNGIFIIPNLSLINFTSSNSALKDNNVTALKAIGDSELLIGTYSGDVYHYQLNNGSIVQLPKSKNAAYRNVTSIIPYGEEYVVIARGAVSVINLKSKKEQAYPSIYIRDMTRTGDSIILASSEMVGVITGLDKLINNHKYSTQSIRKLGGKYVCFDDASKTSWVCFNSGLSILQGDDFKPFTVNGQPLYCNALFADKSGVWAGTISGGLYNIRDKKVALHLDNASGLHGLNVRSIISENDTLYIATDACINIYYPNGKLAYIDYTDGINAKEITSLAIANRHLFIGTIRGLFQLPVSSCITNQVKPYITITSVMTNGADQNICKQIILPWNSSDVLIRFSSVALRSRGKFAYLYRIKGYRNNWERLDGSVNYVHLNHLPPGNYTFEVKAVNEDGLASANTASLSIIAETPYWQQWWFYILLSLAGAGIVTLLFNIRIRRIKRQSVIQNQVVTSQLSALKAQMNPHFMYNTLNSIQDLILQNDIKNTNYYLSRYSSLMRKILDSSEHNEIELAEEIEILQLYMELEKLRFGSDLTYSITVSENTGTQLQIPSMIIQPFVENAIKHGLMHKKGLKDLEVIFSKAGQNLICIIRDNGIGRKRAAEIRARAQQVHKSFATKATERRLELVNLTRKNKIELKITDLEKNGEATGTEVKLIIPLEPR